jgi:cytochrome c
MRLIGWVMFAALWLAAFPATAAPALAQNHGTKEEAVAMVKRAQAMFKKEGAAVTFKAVDDPSNKDFHDRDLYVFIYTLQGECVAHGATPALIGKNLMGMKDQNGRYFFKDMVDIAKASGSGWVDYKWPNPITAKIQDKSAYIERMGENYFVGVGVYFDE